jgi:hypothetical protein
MDGLKVMQHPANCVDASHCRSAFFNASVDIHLWFAAGLAADERGN